MAKGKQFWARTDPAHKVSLLSMESWTEWREHEVITQREPGWAGYSGPSPPGSMAPHGTHFTGDVHKAPSVCLTLSAGTLFYISDLMPPNPTTV